MKSHWIWKEKLGKYWCEKVRKHNRRINDRPDGTLVVKMVLKSNINIFSPYSQYINLEIALSEIFMLKL